MERGGGSSDDYYDSFALDLQHEFPTTSSPTAPQATSRSHGGGGGGRRKKSSKKRAPPLPPIRASSNPKAIFNLPPLKIIKASVGYQGIF